MGTAEFPTIRETGKTSDTFTERTYESSQFSAERTKFLRLQNPAAERM